MKVGDLRAELDGVDDDVEVRLAFQPHYPLEYETGPVVVYEGHEFLARPNAEEEQDFECAACGEPEDEHAEVEGTVVYIGEGGQTWRAYLPGNVAQELGWH